MTNTLELLSTIPIGHAVEDIVVARDSGYAYVSGYSDDVVSVISGGDQVVATIAVGHTPEGLALSPNGVLYVCNLRDASVSVIDTGTNAVVAAVGVGQNPTKVAMSPEGTHAYVINYVDGTVSVIRVADHTNVATISVGNELSGLAVSPDGSYLYVANGAPDGQVSVFDTTRYELQDRIVLGNRGLTHALALAPGGLLACVVLDQSVAVVNLWLGAVDWIDMPGDAVEVLIHPDSIRAYVSCTGSAGAVVEIDLTTKTITRTVSTPTPDNLALTRDGRTLYVTNFDPKTVSEYSTWYVGGYTGG